jgi:hypothetical protein
MVSRAGRLLGILTTQWDTPFSPDEHGLWRIYLLARQAADLIERQAEGALASSGEGSSAQIHHRVKNNMQVIAG